MIKILIIGSNSFSASTFINHLLNLGHEVIGTSRSKESSSLFLRYELNRNLKNFRFVRADINTDLAELIELINAERVTHIVNFAAQSMVGQSWLYPEHWFMTNTVSTISLHNKLKELDFLVKYLHVSTPEVYGSCQGLVRESTTYHPSTPYATSRAAADMSLKNFYDTYGFPVVITRAANVYGEYQQLYRIIPKAILSFLTHQRLPLHGGGQSVRSFIHMDDVSTATYKIMTNGVNGNIYHISTERMISIRELVEMIAEQMKVVFRDNVEIVEDRKGKDAAYLLDSSKLRTELGWADTISLENGIERTIAWVIDNFQELTKQPMHYIHKP